jgi:hypothetical protein
MYSSGISPPAAVVSRIALVDLLEAAGGRPEGEPREAPGARRPPPGAQLRFPPAHCTSIMPAGWFAGAARRRN